MRLHKYIDGQRVQRFNPIINLYLERMGENWQGMFLGLMLPIFAITFIVGLFVPVENIPYTIFMGIIILILFISYIFHGAKQISLLKEDMKRSEKEFLNFCDKNPKQFK